jgi:hypothetical protein
MCLNLRLHPKEEVNYIKKLKGPFIAYKVLWPWNGKLCSPQYPQTKWIKGKTVKSNREDVTDYPQELTDYEVKDLAVFFGLHVYRTREDARIGKGGFKDTQIWRVEIKPKDVVAVGSYCNFYKRFMLGCVVHKAKLLERVR